MEEMDEQNNIQKPCRRCNLGLDQMCLYPQPGKARGKYGWINVHITCQGHRLGLIGTMRLWIATRVRARVRKIRNKH